MLSADPVTSRVKHIECRLFQKAFFANRLVLRTCDENLALVFKQCLFNRLLCSGLFCSCARKTAWTRFALHGCYLPEIALLGCGSACWSWFVMLVAWHSTCMEWAGSTTRSVIVSNFGCPCVQARKWPSTWRHYWPNTWVYGNRQPSAVSVMFEEVKYGECLIMIFV